MMLMKFTDGNLFHIYNKGNNLQKIFFKEDNYFYFLSKIRKYICPHCDLLAYCLLPNRFNFFIHANKQTVSCDEKGRNFLSEGFKYLLSSYTKAINVQQQRTGSLFTQNTHCRKVDDGYFQSLICLLFIHQCPLKAGLVTKLEDWEFSSFRDYCGFRNGSLCRRDLAFDLLKLNNKEFYSMSYRSIPGNRSLCIF